MQKRGLIFVLNEDKFLTTSEGGIYPVENIETERVDNTKYTGEIVENLSFEVLESDESLRNIIDMVLNTSEFEFFVLHRFEESRLYEPKVYYFNGSDDITKMYFQRSIK